MKSEPVLVRKLAVGGIVSLLLLAGCGGGTNPPVSRGSNPTPTMTAISPNSTVAGGAAFTLTINGTNFVAGSTVNFGGSAPATTFVSSTQLTAAIPAASIASTGTTAVTVTNPAPGGGTSKAINFTITNGDNPVPTITGLNPSCGAPEVPVQLTVVGQNFVASSVVRWNGSDLSTASNGASNILTAQTSASDVASAATAAVTVFNPGPGGGSSNAVTFSVTTGAVDPQSIAADPTGKFAYVASQGCGANGYVSMYTINPNTGALASIGPPVSSNDELTDSVTVDPSGNFAYVASSGDLWDIDFGSVATYAINPTTGALTPTGGGITGTGVNGTPEFFSSVAVDPSGKFAYAAQAGAFPAGTYGSSPSVSMYTVNGATGALTSIGLIAAGTSPDSVAVDPAGKFAYVTNFGSNDVSMYTINATTGALASIGRIAAGTAPASVAVDPAGEFAYVANFGSNNVSMYSIDATTGALASIGTIVAGTCPLSVAVDPAGKFAYVANWTGYDAEGSVSIYTIDATTGVLMPTGTIATELSPISIAIHPSGKF
ncbi:MAG: beta-propeller fold lactonase family protein, partial [Candidatus Sulfotelmatobacter sp.]